MPIDVKNAQGATVTVKTIDDLLVTTGEVQDEPTQYTVLARLRDIATALATANATLADLLTGPLVTAPNAGENHLGEVGGRIALIESAITRPADTAAYVSGDLIANDTNVANLNMLSFQAVRIAGGNGKIHRCRLFSTDPAFAGKVVRLHLYRAAPTVTNGDNGAWLTTDSYYMGYFEVTLSQTFSDGVGGVAGPSAGSFIGFQAAAGVSIIYGLLECRSAVTPSSGSSFNAALEVEQN